MHLTALSLTLFATPVVWAAHTCTSKYMVQYRINRNENGKFRNPKFYNAVCVDDTGVTKLDGDIIQANGKPLAIYTPVGSGDRAAIAFGYEPKTGCKVVDAQLKFRNKACRDAKQLTKRFARFDNARRARTTLEAVVECPCPDMDATGDPHVKAWSGERYYFMGECDTIMHTSKNLDIHIRTTIKDFYSFIEATAIRVGNSVLEMMYGNTGSFYINGQEFSDNDLPLKIEDKYTLRKVQEIHGSSGTVYVLEHEDLTVELRNLKSLMGVSINGQDPSFMEGSGGLSGKYPFGQLLGRDGVTMFEQDGEYTSALGITEPVCNAMGQEWQVRDTDPQLFREIREPAWPNQCIFPSEASASASRRRLSSSLDIDAAIKACTERHPEGSVDFDFCVTDVLQMHDKEAANSW